MAELGLQRRGEAQTVRLAVDDELDLASAPQLEQRLRAAAATKPDHIVVDLGQLVFMDCTGVSVLIRAQEAADADGHDLTLAHVPDQVRRLFALIGLSDCFTVQR